ncbi:hypothetical protein [Facilibium subflavum]|uniref:hypothetical protein n=1 Tax=Facilibium subflavum TaxID=2219058 RepID=UPI000E65BF92|nr:hypothetical protein [Facilibium subflavum]
MTLTEILTILINENDFLFIENGREKSFADLQYKALFQKSLIAKADAQYRYVFAESVKINDSDQMTLMPMLFIYDALLSIAKEKIINIDQLVAGENNGK